MTTGLEHYVLAERLLDSPHADALSLARAQIHATLAAAAATALQSGIELTDDIAEWEIVDGVDAGNKPTGARSQDDKPWFCLKHDPSAVSPITRGGPCPGCDPRAAQIADARRMLDFLEANPGLPMCNVGIQVHTDGTDDEGREQVDAAAEILGTSATTSPFGQHYQVEKSFGRAAYEVVLVPKAAMQRHHAVLAAGNAAVDAAHAAEIPAVPATAEADDVDVRALHKAHPTPHLDGAFRCTYCGGLWPCLAIAAADVADDFGTTPPAPMTEDAPHEP